MFEIIFFVFAALMSVHSGIEMELHLLNDVVLEDHRSEEYYDPLKPN